MNMQKLKSLIYQGEKVDVECKKAQIKFRIRCMKHTAHLPILKVGR